MTSYSSFTCTTQTWFFFNCSQRLFLLLKQAMTFPIPIAVKTYLFDLWWTPYMKRRQNDWNRRICSISRSMPSCRRCKWKVSLWCKPHKTQWKIKSWYGIVFIIVMKDHCCLANVSYVLKSYCSSRCLLFFGCDQAALRTLLSVRPSVTPFWQCSCHRIILKFSGVITIDRRDVHAKGQGQRLKVKVTEVMTPFSRFRTVTPVRIHIWWWNDTQILMSLGKLLFNVILKFQGHTWQNIANFDQIERFRTVTPL